VPTAKRAEKISTLTSTVLNKLENRKGFTLLEILIVIAIAGLGLMTVAPRLAENTILTDRTEVFFDRIIETHLKTAKELNRQIFITLYSGSDNVKMYDETVESIPAGNISRAFVNDREAQGLDFSIYFYPDGVFDHFRLVFSDSELEAYPALSKAVRR